MNCMIDLETMGVNLNPAILSIGAVMFDSNCNITDTFYTKINRHYCIDAGLSVDAKTLTWWETQDPKTKEEAFSGTLPLDFVLDQFISWYLNIGHPPVWSNGATSDLVWLEHAYRAINMKPPWPHWATRCYRTLLALHPVTKVKPVIAHHALSDAEAQVHTMSKITAKYGVKF